MEIAKNIPDGFNSVVPYMIAQEPEVLIQFLVSAFDGKEVLCSRRPDGAIANAQVQLGSSTVMISQAGSASPRTTGTYYLYVDDADARQSQALRAGAKSIMDVTDQSYGDRQGGVRDPAGNIWWISQRLTGDPYQD